jgi:hypothetical protein
MTPMSSIGDRSRARGEAGPGTLIVIVLLVIMLLAALLTVWFGHTTSLASPSVSVASTPRMGPLEMKTNRPGRDLSDTGARTDNATQCAAMCASNDACMAMSFAPIAEGKAGVCWLKGSVPEALPNDTVVSAVKAASAPQLPN